MNIQIHSSELNRMMKTISQCIDNRFDKFSNIEISYDNNLLTIRGANGTVSAMMSSPLLGGDGEKFCVDGTMFTKACTMCNGDVSIITSGSDCFIKCNGRVRLPIINFEIPEYVPISAPAPGVFVNAEDFIGAFGSVAHAIAVDQSRIHLTGVNVEVDETGLRMTTLDGFRMAVETADCDGDPMDIIIPGSFMKLIQNSISAGETVHITTDGKRVEACTDGMKIICGLLMGEFPDNARIVPSEFSTECLVKVEQLKSALRSSNVLNSKGNLVKIQVEGNVMKVMSNSEEADYEAEIECDTHGNGILIAFNQKYLMDTINSVRSEEAVMKFNTKSSPCVINGKDENGIRLILPVRIAG